MLKSVEKNATVEAETGMVLLLFFSAFETFCVAGSLSTRTHYYVHGAIFGAFLNFKFQDLIDSLLGLWLRFNIVGFNLGL